MSIPVVIPGMIFLAGVWNFCYSAGCDAIDRSVLNILVLKKRTPSDFLALSPGGTQCLTAVRLRRGFRHGDKTLSALQVSCSFGDDEGCGLKFYELSLATFSKRFESLPWFGFGKMRCFEYKVKFKCVRKNSRLKKMCLCIWESVKGRKAAEGGTAYVCRVREM